jgi:hypothetical protein
MAKMKRFSGCAMFALAAFFCLPPFNLPRACAETVNPKFISAAGPIVDSDSVYPYEKV